MSKKKDREEIVQRKGYMIRQVIELRKEYMARQETVQRKGYMIRQVIELRKE